MQTQKFYQRSSFWFCCTLLWCVVIFCFSAQDATQSNAVSNGVLHKIAEICTAWIPADAMDLEPAHRPSACGPLCGLPEGARGPSELRQVRRDLYHDRRRPGPYRQRRAPGKGPPEHHERNNKLN